jgi:pyruvate formate lyase activating enzyme
MKQNVSTPIYSITPFTLLDYPQRSACILWFAGCNMRCLYCYNPEIVFGKGSISFEKALQFIKNRVQLLDAVVFSGGECLLHKKAISFITKVKKMGFLIKIDTNGSQPKVLEELIQKELIDYVALDFNATKQHTF